MEEQNEQNADLAPDWNAPGPRRNASITRILLWAGAAVLTVSTLTIAVFAVISWQFMAEQEQTLFDMNRQQAHVEQVVKDLALVRKEPFFLRIVQAEALEQPSLDAGQVLNGMLRWRGPAAAGEPPAAAGLELPSDLTDLIDEWGNDWSDHAAEFHPETIDFSWMASLEQYRYWTLTVDSPLGEALKAKPSLDPVEFPLPEYRAMTAWVKLRLLSALKDDADTGAALKETRHLAHLALTSGHLISSMVGISYLGMVSRVEQILGRDGNYPEGWKAVPPETIKAARRSFWGQQGYLDFTVPDELYAKVFPPTGPYPGVCTAIEERMMHAAFAREVVGDRYPDGFVRFEERVKRLSGGCRVGPNRAHYALKVTPAALSGNLFETVSLEDADRGPLASMGDGSQWAAIKKVPPLKHAFGLVLLTVGKSDGLVPYEDAGQ